ncbi:MAG: hypothetical protein MUF19_00645 [Candidatus Pacebacteria bacterium]|jgi:hypothetical protein|nr:hypothetical protein [Candidatus Paceibacterota bacterium]
MECETISWIFEGIGTALVTFLFGLLAGSFTGYKIAIRKSVKINQKQKGGAGAEMTQIGTVQNEK